VALEYSSLLAWWQLSECPGLPMRINNKVSRWKNLEGFVMLGKDESLLYDDELFAIMTNNDL
jgi:hypothetical protein